MKISKIVSCALLSAGVTGSFASISDELQKIDDLKSVIESIQNKSFSSVTDHAKFADLDIGEKIKTAIDKANKLGLNDKEVDLGNLQDENLKLVFTQNSIVIKGVKDGTPTEDIISVDGDVVKYTISSNRKTQTYVLEDEGLNKAVAGQALDTIKNNTEGAINLFDFTNKEYEEESNKKIKGNTNFEDIFNATNDYSGLNKTNYNEKLNGTDKDKLFNALKSIMDSEIVKGLNTSAGEKTITLSNQDLGLPTNSAIELKKLANNGGVELKITNQASQSETFVFNNGTITYKADRNNDQGLAFDNATKKNELITTLQTARDLLVKESKGLIELDKFIKALPKEQGQQTPIKLTDKIFVAGLEDAFKKATGKTAVEALFNGADPTQQGAAAKAAYDKVFAELAKLSTNQLSQDITIDSNNAKNGSQLVIKKDGSQITIANKVYTNDISNSSDSVKSNFTTAELTKDLNKYLNDKQNEKNNASVIVDFYKAADTAITKIFNATYVNVFPSGSDNDTEAQTFFNKDNKDTITKYIVDLLKVAGEVTGKITNLVLDSASGLKINILDDSGKASLKISDNSNNAVTFKLKGDASNEIVYEKTTDGKAIFDAIESKKNEAKTAIATNKKEQEEVIKSYELVNFIKNQEALFAVDLDTDSKQNFEKLLKGDVVKKAALDQLKGLLEKGKALEADKPVSFKDVGYTFTLKKVGENGVITIEKDGKTDTITQSDEGMGYTFETTESGSTLLAQYANAKSTFTDGVATAVNTEIQNKEVKKEKADVFGSIDNDAIEAIVNADYSKHTNKTTGDKIINGTDPEIKKGAVAIKHLLELAKLADEDVVIKKELNGKTYTITIKADEAQGIQIAEKGSQDTADKVDTLKLDENGKIVYTPADTPVIPSLNDKKADLSAAITEAVKNIGEKALKEAIADNAKALVTATDANAETTLEKAKAILDKVNETKFKGIIATLPNEKLEIDLQGGRKLVIKNNQVIIEHTNGSTTIADTFTLTEAGKVELTSTSEVLEDPAIKKLSAESINKILEALDGYKKLVTGEKLEDSLRSEPETAEVNDIDTADDKERLEKIAKNLGDTIANETTTPEDKEKAQKALDKVNEKLAAASAVKPEVDALDAAKTELESAPDDDSKIQAVKAAKEALAAATAKRAEIAAKKAGLTEAEKNIAESLAKLATKGEEVAVGLLSGNKLSTREDLIAFVKDVTASATASTENISKAIDLDIVKFNTDLATQTRLARLANPFNQDLALASAINKLGGSKFADAGNGIDSIIKDYTSRFTHDNNLWGTMLGGKAKSKGGANPSIYGFTLGYDKAFDNAIVGSYISYAKSKANSTSFTNKTDNYQFGVYNRTYFGVNELDAKLTFNIGKNKLERNVLDITNEGKFNSLTTSLDVDYGRVYDLDKSTYVKPFAGFSYTHLKSKSFKESGNLALEHNGVKSTTLALRAGAEFRKYVDNGNYLYVTPGIQSELHKKSSDKIVRFVGTENDIILGGKDKKQTYFTLQTGAEININQNLSTNINFGTKVSKDNKFYNGTIGLRYKF